MRWRDCGLRCEGGWTVVVSRRRHQLRHVVTDAALAAAPRYLCQWPNAWMGEGSTGLYPLAVVFPVEASVMVYEQTLRGRQTHVHCTKKVCQRERARASVILTCTVTAHWQVRYVTHTQLLRLTATLDEVGLPRITFEPIRYSQICHMVARSAERPVHHTTPCKYRMQHGAG